MDDMRAFEQLLTREVHREFGPRRPVDVTHIVRTAVAAKPCRDLGALLTATKLAAATAVIALFGGILLTGVLITESDTERVPAAETTPPATPGPTDDAPALLPGVDLTIEEVEPGVFRVVDDGVRELSWTVDPDHPEHAAQADVVAGRDGSVMLVTSPSLCRGRDEPDCPGDASYYRLGDGRVTRDEQALGLTGVGPHGSLWSFGAARGLVPVLQSSDGSGWSEPHATLGPNDRWMAQVLAADGAVWVQWREALEEGKGRIVLERLDADTDEWTAARQSVDIRSGKTDSLNHMWGLIASPGGEAMYLVRQAGVARLHGISDGHYEVDFVEPPVKISSGSATAGDDGTLWVIGRTVPNESLLARLTWSDGGRRWGLHGPAEKLGGQVRVVGPDGAVWLHREFLSAPCDGIYRYDGTTLTQYLAETCPIATAVAADGTLWLQAVSGGEADTYAIPATTTDSTD